MVKYMFSYENIIRTKGYRKKHLKQLLNMFHDGVTEYSCGKYIVAPEYRLKEIWVEFKEIGFLKLWLTLFRHTSSTKRFDVLFYFFLMRVNKGMLSCYREQWHKVTTLILCTVIICIYLN